MCDDQKESYVRPCVGAGIDAGAVVFDGNSTDDADDGGGCGAEVVEIDGDAGGGEKVGAENSGSAVDGVGNCAEDGGCSGGGPKSGADDGVDVDIMRGCGVDNTMGLNC